MSLTSQWPVGRADTGLTSIGPAQARGGIMRQAGGGQLLQSSREPTEPQPTRA